MSARAAPTARQALPKRDVAAPRPRAAADVSSASPNSAFSHARLAHLKLAARLADEPIVERRWRPRQGLGLAVASSMVLWGAIMAIGAALIS